MLAQISVMPPIMHAVYIKGSRQCISWPVWMGQTAGCGSPVHCHTVLKEIKISGLLACPSPISVPRANVRTRIHLDGWSGWARLRSSDLKIEMQRAVSPVLSFSFSLLAALPSVIKIYQCEPKHLALHLLL